MKGAGALKGTVVDGLTFVGGVKGAGGLKGADVFTVVDGLTFVGGLKGAGGLNGANVFEVAGGLKGADVLKGVAGFRDTGAVISTFSFPVSVNRACIMHNFPVNLAFLHNISLKKWQ